MSKYTKLFETTSQYEDYINGSDVVFSNVCVAKDAPKKVYYNPIPFFAKLYLNNGEVVELQGSGALTSAMVRQYGTSVVSAEIGKLCTSIGAAVFYYCTNLRSITIPNSVTSIDYGAFSDCSNLTSIVVDSANTVYDSRDNCNAIIKTSTNELIAGCKNTVIPNTVTSIGREAFNFCRSLTSITIPDSVTSIGFRAFGGCSGLTSINIPNSVTSIINLAFNFCTSLTSITIPDSVTSIGERAFSSCSGLTNINIPDSVTSIGSGVFSGCSGLTSIVVDSANTVFDSRDNCNAIIKTSTNELIAGCKNTVIPNTVTSIGRDAFNGCTGLTSITIPDSVTSIGFGAFSGCTGLTSITIPDSVTSIGFGAFSGCTGLTSITIPDSVTSIDGDAFMDCTGLTSITSLATTAPTISNNTFYRVKTNGTLTVPNGSTGYDVWMGTGNYYLGLYHWTMVKQ